MVNQSELEWMLRETMDSGCFGEGAELLAFENNSEKKGEDHFASDVLFYKLKIKVDDDVQEVNVVIKVQSNIEALRKYVNTKVQFHNEVLMYTEVLPFLNRDGVVDEVFGKFYHGYVDPTEEHSKDFILMEDLSKDGYRLTKEKVFLDYDHCKLAMQQIGKFHALSYAAKHDNRLSDLLGYATRIQPKMTKERLDRNKELYYLCAKRGVDNVIEEGHSIELLRKFLKNYDDFPEFYASIVKAVEPESVVCHGDFCRNNMFFKYDENGRPISVKFYDLQTPTYSSPAIDLSFFLFLNTSQALRDEHWDDLLATYCDSVQSAIPNVSVPKLDFARAGVYGFIPCSFFLPTMMEDKTWTPEDTTEVFERTPHEQAIRSSSNGGERETKALGDIVRHLLKQNCIKPSYV